MNKLVLLLGFVAFSVPLRSHLTSGGFPMVSASGCLVSAVILSQDLEMVEDLKRLGSSDDS